MFTKIERILLLFLLLLLPSQLAFHFWPSWSLINGIRVDYLSPTLYLTDIIIFVLWIFNSPLQLPSLNLREGEGVSYFRLCLVAFVTLNIFFSYSPLLAIYRWLRVLEYFCLFKYLIHTKINWRFFSWAVVWTSVLAWIQFFLQHSVGGLLFWLGERPLSATMPAVAKVSFLGYQFMRPYATLPHPNALAGFLLVSGLILYSLNRRITPALILAFLTIPITFSRSAIFLEAIILFLWLRPWLLKISLLISSFYFLISISGSIVSDRLPLILNSMSLILKHPLLGVGLGNFLPVTHLYQPVHNIYLLLASELGLPAALIICSWIVKNLLKIENWNLKIAILVVAATGLIDHYWLTLHQPALLLVLLLSLLYEPVSKSSPKHRLPNHR